MVAEAEAGVPSASVPVTALAWIRTCRLIPSRFPSVGPFDRVASAGELEALFELEGWTNDRLSHELGVLSIFPRAEWVVGPMASVVMAAFCHPAPDGARFSGADRGAWYAGRTLETALAESIYRRTQELVEVGVRDLRVQTRLYHADVRAPFHDIRAQRPVFAPLYDPDRYERSQRFGRDLLEAGSNGIAYRSVRHPAGECLACFRPRLIQRVRLAGHYEFLWEGSLAPRVRKIG